MEAVEAGWMVNGIWDGHMKAWLSEGIDLMDEIKRQNEDNALHGILISDGSRRARGH